MPGNKQVVTVNPEFSTWSRGDGARVELDSDLYVAPTQTRGTARPSSGRNPISASIVLDSELYVVAPKRRTRVNETAEVASSSVVLDSEQYVASAAPTPGGSGIYDYIEVDANAD
jgi:hypothetical protein